MPFYTEKQTEEWLESEMRYLPMPDGSTRPVTAFRLVWSKVDSLILLNGHTLEDLVGYAVEEATLQRITLDRALTCVVAWLDNRRRDRWGI